MVFMAGLAPAIHVWFHSKKFVDAHDRREHDEG
jgi:hypothetical protein